MIRRTRMVGRGGDQLPAVAPHVAEGNRPVVSVPDEPDTGQPSMAASHGLDIRQFVVGVAAIETAGRRRCGREVGPWHQW